MLRSNHLVQAALTFMISSLESPAPTEQPRAATWRNSTSAGFL